MDHIEIAVLIDVLEAAMEQGAEKIMLYNSAGYGLYHTVTVVESDEEGVVELI